jgi:hypothetical protein
VKLTSRRIIAIGDRGDTVIHFPCTTRKIQSERERETITTDLARKADVLTDLVQYHRLADETLELYQEELSQIQDVMTDFDCECSVQLSYSLSSPWRSKFISFCINHIDSDGSTDY